MSKNFWLQLLQGLVNPLMQAPVSPRTPPFVPDQHSLIDLYLQKMKDNYDDYQDQRPTLKRGRPLNAPASLAYDDFMKLDQAMRPTIMQNPFLGE